jgi:hypothetical protein
MENKMAYTPDSKLADILKHPNIKAIIEKHFGRSVGNEQLQMVMGMTLLQVANFLGWTNEKVDAVLNDLNR